MLSGKKKTNSKHGSLALSSFLLKTVKQTFVISSLNFQPSAKLVLWRMEAKFSCHFLFTSLSNEFVENALLNILFLWEQISFFLKIKRIILLYKCLEVIRLTSRQTLFLLNPAVLKHFWGPNIWKVIFHFFPCFYFSSGDNKEENTDIDNIHL